MGLRKCASLPSLSSNDTPRQLEIYCGKRPLVELSQKVPPRWRGVMQDIGVAHYYVVVRRIYCSEYMMSVSSCSETHSGESAAASFGLADR